MKLTHKEDDDVRLTKLAIRSTIQHRKAVILQGLLQDSIEELPERIINQIPVYHTATNTLPINLPEWNRSALYFWGSFHYPDLFFGMPESIGGNIKLYIDTRITGWYLLWMTTHLDEWAMGKTNEVEELIAWTPRCNKDSIIKAGYRLCTTAAYIMDGLEKNQTYNHVILDCEHDYFRINSWKATKRAVHVWASIRQTEYLDSIQYESNMNTAPEYLKENIQKLALFKTN